MADLIAKSACAGLLPLHIGTVTASEAELGMLTSVLLYRGKAAALSRALKSSHGLAIPDVMRMTGKEGVRAIWFGKDQFMLVGPRPDGTLAQCAALSDQSDAWACVELSGLGAEAVLARLVPVDLRADSFKTGHSVRTMIQHMNGSVTRLGRERFLLMVFRSMAATLVHDLKVAMESVAARN